MKTKTRSTAARRRKVQIQKWKLLPDIKKIPRDKEWEAVELRIAEHITKNPPPFEE